MTPDMPQESLAFFGTPQLAVEILDAMEKAGFSPAVVVTAGDARRGKSGVTPTPVALWAAKRGTSVMKPERLDDRFLEEFKKHTVALGVVVAYGKILPQTLLDMPRLGMWNVHYSLLPRWRGAAPVEAAILAGDDETGVTIQRIVLELDAGPIAAVEKTAIREDETAPELRGRLNEMAKELLIEELPRLLQGTIALIEQDPRAATRCGKTEREDGELSLADDPRKNYRKYRAYYGWPGVYFLTERGTRVKIADASFEDGHFMVKRVIPEGKREMSYEDFLRSSH